MEKKLSVQEQWAKAAQEGIERARQMTHAECLHQARINSGWYDDHPEDWPKDIPKPKRLHE
jgi:hypothetical protein